MQMISFREAVVFPTVKDRPPPPKNPDAAVGARRRSAKVGIVVFVYEHIGVAAVCHTQVAIRKDQGEVRGQAHRLADLIVARNGCGVGSVFDALVDFSVIYR